MATSATASVNYRAQRYTLALIEVRGGRPFSGIQRPDTLAETTKVPLFPQSVLP